MFLENSVMAMESEKDLTVDLDKSDIGEDVTVESTSAKDSVTETEETVEVINDDVTPSEEPVEETASETNDETAKVEVEVEVKVVGDEASEEEEVEAEVMSDDEVIEEEDEVKAEEVALEELEDSPLNNLEISINEDLSGIELDIEEIGSITIDVKKLDEDVATAEAVRSTLEIEDAEGAPVEGEDLPVASEEVEEGEVTDEEEVVEPAINDEVSNVVVESANAILNIIGRSWGFDVAAMKSSVATESLSNGEIASEARQAHGALTTIIDARSMIVQEGIKETFKRIRNTITASGRAKNLRDDLIKVKELVKAEGKELKPAMKPINAKLASYFIGSPSKVTMRNIAKQVDDTLLSITYLQKAVKDLLELTKLADSLGKDEKSTAKLVAKAKEISKRSPLNLEGFLGTAKEPLVGNVYWTGGSKDVVVGDDSVRILYAGKSEKLKSSRNAEIETGNVQLLTKLIDACDKAAKEFDQITAMFNNLYTSNFLESESKVHKGISKYATEQAFVLIAIYSIIGSLFTKTGKGIVAYASFSIKNK